MASTFGPESLRQDVLVEREIGEEELQRGILLLKLANPAHLVDPEVPVALLPDLERGLADPELAAHVAGGPARRPPGGARRPPGALRIVSASSGLLSWVRTA